MMKRWLNLTVALVLAGGAAQAQATSEQRIPVSKDTQMSSGGDVVLTPSADSADIAAARASGYWFRAPSSCRTMDLGDNANVQLKTDLYDSATMISPDMAKRVALCAVPGQIGSGEMNMSGNRAEYEIAIIPNGKKTYSKVIVDAQTGAVLSTKQFGGARGFAGWVRESFEHKQNTP